MKKYVIIILFTLISSNIFSQENETKTIYCELVGTSTLLGKVTVEIDIGESKGFLAVNTSYITDEKGKPKKFNSMVDAMNFMGDKGWDFAQAYVAGENGAYVYHWLLKQTIAKGKDGQYYPVTKKVFGN
jgi:hypothetical protein